MDRDITLSEEYFDKDTFLDNDVNIDGREIDFQTSDNFVNFDDSNEYKMLGEEDEEEYSTSIESNNYKVNSSNALSDDNSKEKTPLENSVVEPSKPEITDNKEPNYNDTVKEDSEILYELDEKIKNLEKILSSSTTLNESSSTTVNENNTVNSNVNAPANYDAYNSNINKETLNDNTDVNNIQKIKNVIHQLNELRTIKQNFENKIKNNTTKEVKSINNIFKDSGKVLFDSFTPNFRIDPSDKNYDPDNPKPWKKEKATEVAIDTERAMGGEPVVEVSPSLGEVVIDSSSQNSVEEAIQQHGGLDNALEDSITNQQNYNNYIERDDNPPSNETTIVTPNEEKNYSSENKTSESYFKDINSSLQKDEYNYYTAAKNGDINNINNNDNDYGGNTNPDTDIVKNTGESIVILNKISNQLDNINKVLSKSFNNLGKSIKEIKTEQKNLYYQNTNNTNDSTPQQMQKNTEPNNIPNIRGDLPLQQDFPMNFDRKELFSNLRNE